MKRISYDARRIIAEEITYIDLVRELEEEDCSDEEIALYVNAVETTVDALI